MSKVLPNVSDDVRQLTRGIVGKMLCQKAGAALSNAQIDNLVLQAGETLTGTPATEIYTNAATVPLGAEDLKELPEQFRRLIIVEALKAQALERIEA